MEVDAGSFIASYIIYFLISRQPVPAVRHKERSRPKQLLSLATRTKLSIVPFTVYTLTTIFLLRINLRFWGYR